MLKVNKTAVLFIFLCSVFAFGIMVHNFKNRNTAGRRVSMVQSVFTAAMKNQSTKAVTTENQYAYGESEQLNKGRLKTDMDRTVSTFNKVIVTTKFTEMKVESVHPAGNRWIPQNPATDKRPKLQSIVPRSHVIQHTVKKDPQQTSSAALINPKVQSKFELIARGHLWGGGETISGTGSTLESTESVRNCLGWWIKKYDVTSIVDIPCGDGHWQKYIPGIATMSYKGYDISPYAVMKARRSNPSNMKYDVLDVTSEVPPKADLVIMRDVIQHLPLHLGLRAIENVKKSGAKWLGVSSYVHEKVNKEIAVGDYYRNNVEIDPFNLRNVFEVCDNYAGKVKQDYLDSKFLLIKLTE